MKHFQIIALPRSGSTYLFRIIREHINPTGNEYTKTGLKLDRLCEPFNRYLNDFTQTSINDTIDYIHKSNHPLTIKHHLANLYDLQAAFPGEYERWFSQEFYNIRLLRRNLFQSTLSAILARRNEQWTDYVTIKQPTIINKFHMIDELKNQINNMNTLITNTLNIKFNETIIYEDLNGDASHDFEETQIKSTHQINDSYNEDRLKSPSKSSTIINYVELKILAKEYIEYLSTSHQLGYLTIEETTITDFNLE